jgi:RNA polymerase sigma-70 factor (ECF subfamily)
VVEFEGVKTDFHRSLGVKHHPRHCAVGLLSLTEREGQSWQRQTVELYDLLNRVLYRYLGGLGLAEESAEDVTQETFLRLAAHLKNGGDAGNLRAWIFEVAYNLAMDIHRLSRRNHAATDWTELGDGELIDPNASPECAYLENERQHRLKQAMNSLTPRQRSCILLRTEGLRYREIASILGVSEQRAIHLVKRGLERLSEEL